MPEQAISELSVTAWDHYHRAIAGLIERIMKSIRLASLLLSCALCLADSAAPDRWQPAQGPLMTRWAKDVSPKNAHPEYPRPQMVRKEWRNLNGQWDYAIRPKDESQPAAFDGKILVPFPVESALSGVMRQVGEQNRLWYRRVFALPKSWSKKRVVLHFGAVDWETAVFVNGREVGSHRGGYDAFTFDITDALNARGENEIVVSVWDPADAGPQPRGKQVRKPGGIWYTPTSGIWQTVWLEPVAFTHIASVKIIPDLDRSAVTVLAHPLSVMGSEVSLRVEVLDGKERIQAAELKSTISKGISSLRVALNVPRSKPWTPDSPHLYGLRLTMLEDGRRVDEVESYFGMRKISMARDNLGRLRMQLNNKNYFMLGPLDQGFWPDGLYTAPTDEALRSDIEVLKKLGFNTVRKHVKVEPDRWYYWCDKLGLLVWQDMPSGDKSAEWRGPSGVDGQEMTRSAESAEIYERELRTLIDGRGNHPSIVVWVPFNEGWGQFDTARILNLTRQVDPTRLVDGASGGNHFPAGDILDHHQYPGPGAPTAVTDRAMVLGEFGGLGLPVKGHTWQAEKNWGYRSFKTPEELTDAYLGLIKRLRPMIEETGLSAAIYTQTTDVEVEINGLMTYDRALVKMNAAAVTAANKSLY
jgi:beta-galactosidase/beta-glucuronidase